MNEPTVASGLGETRKCVATKNFLGHPLPRSYDHDDADHALDAHRSCASGQISVRLTCHGHVPVYEAEPSAPAASETAPDSYYCQECRDTHKTRDGCPNAGKSASPAGPLAELDAAISAMERALERDEVYVRTVPMRDYMHDVRVVFNRIRGSALEPEAVQNYAVYLRDAIEPGPEPSAPTGRDPDCAYCVRLHPDERCTCVPSANAPRTEIRLHRRTPAEVNEYWAKVLETAVQELGDYERLAHRTVMPLTTTLISIAIQLRTPDPRDAEIATLRADAHRHYVSTMAMQDDIRAVLDALGLFSGARNQSPHEVMVDDIVPAIRALKAAKEQAERERVALTDSLTRSRLEVAEVERQREAMYKEMMARNLTLREIAKVAEEMTDYGGWRARIIALAGTEAKS